MLNLRQCVTNTNSQLVKLTIHKTTPSRSIMALRPGRHVSGSIKSTLVSAQLLSLIQCVTPDEASAGFSHSSPLSPRIWAVGPIRPSLVRGLRPRNAPSPLHQPAPPSSRDAGAVSMPPVAHPPRAAPPPLPLCHLSLTRVMPPNLPPPTHTGRGRPCACPVPRQELNTIPPTAAHSPPDPFGPRIWKVPVRRDASRTIVSSQPALSSRAEIFVRQTTNGRRPS